jgi:hypothetical protein
MEEDSVFDVVTDYVEENMLLLQDNFENGWQAPFAMEEDLSDSDGTCYDDTQDDSDGQTEMKISREAVHEQQCRLLRQCDGFGAKLVVFTYSTIYSKIQDAVSELDCTIHKLSEYKSEKNFTKDIEMFFETSQAQYFLLQCDMKSDYHHILLAKSIIENSRKCLTKKFQKKHVCIVIHLKQSSDPHLMFNKINFSTGWILATLDSIEKSPFSLPDLYNKPVLQILGAEEEAFNEIICRQLPWSSTRIQYQSITDKIIDVQEITKSKAALNIVSDQIQNWIRRHCDIDDNMNWQHKAACDKHLLETSATMISTLESHLSSLIQEPLARILFCVENSGILNCLLSLDKMKPELKIIFESGCDCKDFYDIDAAPPPTGPGCYLIEMKTNQLKVPFSKAVFRGLENFKSEALDDVRRSNIIPGHLQVADNVELKETMLAIVHAYTELIYTETQLFDIPTFDHILDDLKEDFCHYSISSVECRLSEEEKVSLMKWILKHLVGNAQIYDVHFFLMTLHLWTWTYFQSIVGIFHLFDLWKAQDENAMSAIQYKDMNETSISKSLKNIVDLICQDILHQCERVEEQGLEDWQENVYKFMTIIGTIGVSSHKTETMKFLNDFVAVVCIPRKRNISSLHQFATCVSHFDWNLARVEVLESLWQQLQSIQDEAHPLELQQVACSFIARCNSISVDNDSERDGINLGVIKMIGQGKFFESSLRFYGHCLKLSLLDYFPDEEEELEPHVFAQILETFDDENSTFDEFLGELHLVLQTESVPSSLPALLVSVLEDEVYSTIITNEKLEAISAHSDFLIRKMFQARDILKDQCDGLPYCAAVAYIKTFLAATARLISMHICQNNHLLYAVDQLLCSATESRGQKSIQNYFIECLQRNSGENELYNIAKELSESMQFFRTNVLPAMMDLDSGVLSLNLIRYCKDSRLSHLRTVLDISEENDFLQKIMDNEEMGITMLLCLLHNRVFYIESLSMVADSDRRFGKSVERATAEHKNSKLKLLIKHLIDQQSCHRKLLRQDLICSAEATGLTTFLIHIASLIVINNSKNSTLYRAAIHHEIPDFRPEDHSLLTPYQIQNCKCNHRIATDENKDCPWCTSNMMNTNTAAVPEPMETRPYSSIVRAILIDSALVTTSLFENAVNEFGMKEVETREKGLVTNWQKLRNSLQISDSEQCQLLMIFIENVKEIFSDPDILSSGWNPKYDAELKEVLRDRHHQLRRDNIRHKELLSTVLPAMQEDESEEYMLERSEEHLFRVSEKPSIDNMYFELQLSKTRDSFPCLNMILENLEMFQFPQHIEGILQWHRLLISKCSYSLKKVDCKYLSAGSFINQQNKEFQRKLRESFKRFTDTWEKICNLVALLEHHSKKLPSIEKITEDSKMDVCVLKDKDSVMFQVLHALCFVQNKILDKVLQICVVFKCKSLGFLQLGCSQAAIPIVPLTDLQKKQLIESVVREDGEKLELFAQCGYDEESRYLEYDFRKLEVEWAYKFFHNRAYILIDETMMFMEFKDDLYGHCVQLLHKVSALVPQTGIDPTTETKIKERCEDDPSKVPQLLTVIGTVTTVIVRKKASDKHVHIAEFVERLEGLQVISMSGNCLLPFTEFNLTLSKVVAFYTLLEEMNGKKYFNALDSEFRDAMQDRTKRQITANVSGRIRLLKACESAMHVFLHRFLYVRDNEISLQQPIADYLSNTELWKETQIENERIKLHADVEQEFLLQDVFPQELQIKHIYRFLELLKEQIKVLDYSTIHI